VEGRVCSNAITPVLVLIIDVVARRVTYSVIQGVMEAIINAQTNENVLL
jgi:hypothetical protein